jgi:hypothetical protein
MQADSDVDALVDWHLAVPLGHAALEVGRALHRIHYARELGEKAVSYKLEDAAAMLRDFRLEKLLAMCPQALEGARFILLHEPAVPDHIGGQDGGELAVHNSTTWARTINRLLSA